MNIIRTLTNMQEPPFGRRSYSNWKSQQSFVLRFPRVSVGVGRLRDEGLLSVVDVVRMDSLMAGLCIMRSSYKSKRSYILRVSETFVKKIIVSLIQIIIFYLTILILFFLS